MARPEWPLLAAWLLAAVLFATGLGKALDVAGFARVLVEFRLFPVWAVEPLAVAVTLLELGLALALLVPAWRSRAAWAAVALFLANAAVLSLTLLRGIDLVNCGCFGVFLARPLRVFTPLEDIALALLGLFAVRAR